MFRRTLHCIGKTRVFATNSLLAHARISHFFNVPDWKDRGRIIILSFPLYWLSLSACTDVHFSHPNTLFRLSAEWISEVTEDEPSLSFLCPQLDWISCVLHLAWSNGGKVCLATFKSMSNFCLSVKWFERAAHFIACKKHHLTNAYNSLPGPPWIYFLFFLSGSYPAGCSPNQNTATNEKK